LEIDCKDGGEEFFVQRFSTMPSSPLDDGDVYDIIMSLTSFKTISLTCCSTRYDSITVEFMQSINGVEKKNTLSMI
jgi:hypothetical protein